MRYAISSHRARPACISCYRYPRPPTRRLDNSYISTSVRPRPSAATGWAARPAAPGAGRAYHVIYPCSALPLYVCTCGPTCRVCSVSSFLWRYAISSHRARTSVYLVLQIFAPAYWASRAFVFPPPPCIRDRAPRRAEPQGQPHQAPGGRTVWPPPAASCRCTCGPTCRVCVASCRSFGATRSQATGRDQRVSCATNIRAHLLGF